MQEISDSKEQPPGYGEALTTPHSVGHTYAEKILANAGHVGARSYVIHATENNNFVLLLDGQASYFVDNSSSLSKVILRRGGDTKAAVISMGAIERPFVKEVVTSYTSKLSGSLRTLLEGSGKFSTNWSFTCNKLRYTWKSSKGSWSCLRGDQRIATYNAGHSLDVSEAGVVIVDIIVSTVYSV